MIDGWHRGRNLRQLLNWDVTARVLQFTAAAIRDVIRERQGKPPYLVPVAAGPGQLAAFTEPEAKATFEALGGEAAGWRSAVAPWFIFALPRYRKGTAEQLSMPVLLCLADRDVQASTKCAARIAAKMPAAKVLHYPAGHFDVYQDRLFEEISNAEADFLEDNLRARTRARDTAVRQKTA